MASSDRKLPLGHPLLWPTWIGVFIFRLLNLLPCGMQLRIGKWLGRFFFHFVRFRRHVVDVNLRLCMPEMSAKERHALAKAHYEAMGMGLLEAGMSWWTPDNRLPDYEIDGAANLETAIGRGKGVLLLSAHFTTLEICGRLFANDYTLGGLYREPDNPVIAHEMYQGRLKKLTPAVEMSDLRGLIRSLRDGATIWYAPDQSRRSKFTSVLPFFGVPAVTNTATSRIAEMTGAAIVPFFGTRRPDGTYLLKILPALDNFPTDDAEQDAVRINQLIEEYVRKAPEQYFWIHRRFKRRGKGYQNVYKR